MKPESQSVTPKPDVPIDKPAGPICARFCSPKRFILILGVALFFLHQDFWNWTDRHLVFGFLPVGLAYHALFTIAAALLWAYAIRIAWPKDLEAWAEEGNDSK